jgi:hypothetical protein
MHCVGLIYIVDGCVPLLYSKRFIWNGKMPYKNYYEHITNAPIRLVSNLRLSKFFWRADGLNVMWIFRGGQESGTVQIEMEAMNSTQKHAGTACYLRTLASSHSTVLSALCLQTISLKILWCSGSWKTSLAPVRCTAPDFVGRGPIWSSLTCSFLWKK